MLAEQPITDRNSEPINPLLAPVPNLNYEPPNKNVLVTHIQRDSTQISS